MLILASASPRRKELLKKLKSEFTVMPAEVDERSLDHSFSSSTLALEEARMKAYYIHALYPTDSVLSCDTIVILDGEVLGKPKNEEDAVRMLMKENGKRQVVLSAYCYISERQEVTRTVSSYVYFNKLSEEEIRSYVKKYRPFDKAGGYGIQDESNLINHIEGSYDNVMGLPTEDIYNHVFKLR